MSYLVSRQLFGKIRLFRNNNLQNFAKENVIRKNIKSTVLVSQNFATSIENNTPGAKIPTKKHAPTNEVSFTADKYTYLRRNPNFKKVTTIKYFLNKLN